MHYFRYIAVAVLSLSGLITADNCKCVPSDPCWPAPAEWTSLNETLFGHLIRGVPPGAVCYPSRPEYNEEACQTVLANWTSSPFHSGNPVSIHSAVWANNSCNPIYENGTSVTGDTEAGKRGCSDGAYPAYVVNATQAIHVQEALRFAKHWNLRVNIKNTGHSGAGRNTAFGSLSIWTHNLKQIDFHNQYQPQGCAANSTHMAAVVGAGVQDGELFDAMSKNNATAVGGTNDDVGVVGWATGGGHGFATGEYGMGADNIIEAQVVTPSGELLTANSCQNQDILWAIRGGGGGTFGVILSVTLKAYPSTPLSVWGYNIAKVNSTSDTDWWNFMAKFHVLLSQAQDQRLTGYWTLGNKPTLNIAGSMFLWNAGNDTLQRAVEPLRNFLSVSNGTVTYTATTFVFPSLTQLRQTLSAGQTVSTDFAITASRLITKRTVTENTELFAQTLEKIGPKSDDDSGISMSGTLTIGKTPVDNALNPVWRDTVVHLIVSQRLNSSLASSKAGQLVDDMTFNKLNALRLLDPTSGAYFNEANAYEPGWQWSFFGRNYGRLHAIKTKYDPEGLLWCPQCVGSENWVQTEDGLLCRSFQPLKV